MLGAWVDGACHIGNVESDLTNSGQNPFVYPGCVNQLGVPGLTGNAGATTFFNRYSTGLGPRIGFALDPFANHKTTVRGGYGIYYVREDVGAVDQLSFQTPFLPIVFAGSTPGGFTNFFAPCAASNPLPYSPYCDQTTGLNPPGGGNPNALPAAGVLSPAFLPCLSVLQGFVTAGGAPTTDPSQTAVYANQAGCTGIGSFGDFALEVPRHFKVPNTQQWNLTIQRDLGKQWVLEVGYVGTHAVHLRETRDANPVTRRDGGEPGGGQGRERGELLDHYKHVCECRGADADSRVERLCRLPAFCERCVFALPLAADDAFAALERWLSAGGVYVFEIHGRNVDGKYRVQYRLQRPEQRQCFARALRLRPAAPIRGELRLRPPFFREATGVKRAV